MQAFVEIVFIETIVRQLEREHNPVFLTISDRNCGGHQIVILPMEMARILICYAIESFIITCSGILSHECNQNRSKRESR